MRNINMSEVKTGNEEEFSKFSLQNEVRVEEDEISRTFSEESALGEVEDDNNLYLLGVLDQDLNNGWEAWMALLTSEEILPEFSDMSLEKMLERSSENWENATIMTFPMDGNVTSKPPPRPPHRRGLLLSKKQLKAIAQSMRSFPTNLIEGAESWLRRIFHFGHKESWRSFSDVYCQSDFNSTIFKKWISVKQSTDRENQMRCFSSGPSKSEGFSTMGKMRIELKTYENGLPLQSGEDEDCLRLKENEWIRIKVTSFCSALDFYQIEMDLVQSFVCTNSTDRCRRRIVKVLKREIIPEIEWEKGVNAAGNNFAVHWNRFQIPELTSIEEDKHDKFVLCNLQYELRLRFFSDDESGQTVASTCSFPLVVMEPEEKQEDDLQPTFAV